MARSAHRPVARREQAGRRVSLVYAPWVKRLAQFTPSEIERMAPSDARWVLENLPHAVRLLAEIELTGEESWGPACVIAFEIGEVRQAMKRCA